MTDLLRTQQYIVATGRGMITQADTDSVHAAAVSSIYNPLGHAIANLLETVDSKRRTYSASKFDAARRLLERSLIAYGVRAVDAFDAAGDALLWYMAKWCPMCNGAEALTIEQAICPLCNGSRERQKPTWKLTERAISEVHAAVEYFESQQGHRLSNGEVRYRRVDWDGEGGRRLNVGLIAGCVTPIPNIPY